MNNEDLSGIRRGQSSLLDNPVVKSFNQTPRKRSISSQRSSKKRVPNFSLNDTSIAYKNMMASRDDSQFSGSAPLRGAFPGKSPRNDSQIMSIDRL